MENVEFKIEYKVYKSLNDIDLSYQKLYNEAYTAATKSYSPYSNFQVGSSVLFEDSSMFSASNQENAAYPSGLCAERITLFSAQAMFPEKKIIAMMVLALKKNELIDYPVSPCGACRQVMLESEDRNKQAIKLFCVGKNSIIELDNLSMLLPLSFSSKML